jgi:transglutaminase-like putative cysteine protease
VRLGVRGGVLGAAVALAALASASVLGLPPDPWKNAARYEFEYRVHLAAVGPSGLPTALWVPYPIENQDQQVLDVRVDSPWAWRVTQESRFSNRMIYAEGLASPGTPDLVLHVRVERRPSVGIPAGVASAQPNLRPDRYLLPDKLVPLTGIIREVADRAAQGHDGPAEKARAFYDYVYGTMTYNKDGTGWGRGDAVWACTNKRGNCTDFHSLFIGMLRSQGIPGRFLIGFPIPEGDEGAIGGYHCWAQFYLADRGWVPVDVSEANKKRIADAYFGALPSDRIEFSAGRDIVLNPPQKGEPLNYFIYPYVEIDGKPGDAPKVQFRFTRLAAP